MKYHNHANLKQIDSIWFERIPSSWTSSRLKYALEANDGGVWGDEGDINDTPVLRSTEITIDGNWSIESAEYRKLSNSDFKKGLLVDGDLLVTKSSGSDSHIGKTALVNNHVANMKPAFSNFMQRLRCTDKFHPKYIYYILNNAIGKEQINYLASTTTGLKNLNGGVLADISVVHPSLDEQTQIATFLDRETAKINKLIDKQQQLIKLLEEKRQAVISHAVTKGLNPDVPFKDSGVEWLGDVPEHWQVKSLKFTSKPITKKTTINGQQVIALENIESWTGRYIETNASYSGEDIGYIEGDILFGKLRPYLAKVYLAKTSGVAFGDILVYRPSRQSMNNLYCHYQMLSDGFITEIDSSTYGSKMPRASVDFISNTFIAVPPMAEQQEIVQYLTSVLLTFSKLSQKASELIQLMKERRTALISAAVTGKIDVRNTI